MDRRKTNRENDRKPYAGGPQRTEKEQSDTLVIGRNAVIELLKSGRDVNKIYVRRGEMTGSLSVIAAEAASRRIPLSEVENAKLDKMSGGAAHQGVIASAAVRNYSTVDEILSLAAERGEKPLILMLDGSHTFRRVRGGPRCDNTASRSRGSDVYRRKGVRGSRGIRAGRNGGKPRAYRRRT